MAIQIGSIVWLTTGSDIAMGVNEMRNNAAVCVWHDRDGKPHEREYAIALLTEEEPPELDEYLP